MTGRVCFETARVTEAFRTHLGVGRAEAESLTDALRAGREVRVHAETAEAAGALSIALRDAGAGAEPMAD